MSTVERPAASLADAADVDLKALGERRFVTAFEASLIAGLHLETVREALRAGDLHGSQRVKGGTWKIRPECIDPWLDGEPCAHLRAPVVSLASRRRRA